MSSNMETSFTFRNMDSTDALKEHAADKLGKLDKYIVGENANAHVIFKVDGPSRHQAEITINMRGNRYFGAETSNDMYTSIDSAVHKIESQLARHKKRVTEHKGA